MATIPSPAAQTRARDIHAPHNGALGLPVRPQSLPLRSVYEAKWRPADLGANLDKQERRESPTLGHSCSSASSQSSTSSGVSLSVQLQTSNLVNSNTNNLSQQSMPPNNGETVEDILSMPTPKSVSSESSLSSKSSERKSSQLSSHDIDHQVFCNPIERSFEFQFSRAIHELDGHSASSNLYISEIMAEACLSFQLPQIIMNMFMDDEKKLMNCVTYSLGELVTQWQRPQMRVLESHLRLVNILTESINDLYQLTTLDPTRMFRASRAKKELHLQFVPINLHLQRVIVSHGTGTDGFSGNRTESPAFNSAASDSDGSEGSSDLQRLPMCLDIHTVGAFAAHHLGHDHGGLRTPDSSELRSPTNNNNQEMANQSVGRVWRAMRDYFKIADLALQIECGTKNFAQQVMDLNCSKSNNSFVHEKACQRAYSQLESWAEEIVNILNPSEVEQSLLSVDLLREEPNVLKESPLKFERSLSENASTNQNSKLNQDIDLNRRHSMPTEESSEIEPVDLLHLNIRASLISISSKLNSTRQATTPDYEPSHRKLKAAINALLRVSSLTYAVEAVKLANDRQALERFNTMRLRRSMVFSQALTSLVVAVTGQVKSNSTFLERIRETRTIFVYFESLLSCHADELGMIQDMAFAVNELNNCVSFVFVPWTSNSSPNGPSASPRIDGNGHNIRVIIAVDSSSLLSNMTLNCSVTALMFNIGINEHATLAETLGYVRLQDEINKKSFYKLENYVTNLACLENNVLIDELAALRSELYSQRAKNVRVLQLMESIARKLQGIRFTSCKSAKDRTGMAVTLEEARLCFEHSGLNELKNSSLLCNMLDKLRTEGTRRENTKKNIGAAKYAFNSLQCMTLPKLYRPPAGTYGNVQS
ncbi:Inositol polyphosphate-4-phosphatase type I A [Halotydeus destructor]|nr:Inositol polyphosphate-4-phosphatase type I A [Halotydeus destructor]